MTCYYTVLCTRELLLYPIKADTNPHDPTKYVYCPGQPHFFGGGSEPQDKNWIETLRRETHEESAATYYLYGAPIARIFADTFPRRGRQVVGEFYYADEFIQLLPWPEFVTWASAPAKLREMCWIATIAPNAFNPLMDDQSINLVLLQNARRDPQAPDWARRQMADDLTKEYQASLYYRAFGELIRNWTAGRLFPP